jgi:hypothetical protein
VQNSKPSLLAFTGDVPVPRDSLGQGIDTSEWKGGAALEPILE